MKNTKLILGASLLAIATSKAAIAQDNLDKRWYLAPSVAYIWTDEDRLTSRNDYGVYLGVGKAISKEFNVELRAFTNRFEHLNSNGKTQYQWESYGASTDLQYYFNRDKFSPYAVGGLGFMDSRVQGRNAVGLVAEGGLGVAYKISDSISLRSDVRYRYNESFNKHLVPNETNEYNEMLVNVGVVIPLGKAPSKTTPVPVAKPAAEKRLEKSVTLKGVNFEINSATLTPLAKIILTKVANDIKNGSNDGAIEIGGHSSPDGNAERNQILSEQRAQSVVAYLKEKGVTNEMTAKGYGSSMPISDNKLENRRVELTWK